MSLGQEYALARYREDTKRDLNEPALYARRGNEIWLSVLKNAGWFVAEFAAGKLIGLYSSVFGGRFDGAYNWMRPDTINPKQARKIEAVYENSRQTN